MWIPDRHQWHVKIQTPTSDARIGQLALILMVTTQQRGPYIILYPNSILVLLTCSVNTLHSINCIPWDFGVVKQQERYYRHGNIGYCTSPLRQRTRFDHQKTGITFHGQLNQLFQANDQLISHEIS